MKLNDNERHALRTLLIPSVSVSFFVVSSIVIATHSYWRLKESVLNTILFVAVPAIIVFSILLLYILAGVSVIIENEKNNHKKMICKLGFFIVIESVICGFSFLFFGFSAVGSFVACAVSRFVLNLFA